MSTVTLLVSPEVRRAMADCMPRDRRVIGRLLHIFHDPQIEEAAKIAALLDATMVNTYLPTAVMTALIACITAFQLGKGKPPEDSDLALWRAVQQKRIETSIDELDTFLPRPERRRYR